MMEIYIIRHGETDGNKKNQLQGRRNILLNEKGRAVPVVDAEFRIFISVSS